MTAFTELAQEIYTDFQNEEYAKESILTKVYQGEPNYTTGATDPIELEYTVYSLFLSPSDSKATPEDFSLRDGDKLVNVATNGIEPTTEDTLTIDDHKYTIKTVVDEAVGARGLFTLHLR